MVWFGWLIFFGAFAEKTYGVAAGMLSALFLIGGGGELIGNNLAPWLMRRTSARFVAISGLTIAAVTLLLTGIAWNQRWTLFPYIAIGSFALAIVYIGLNVTLLDSLPANPGATMSLLSACFEIGSAIGVALAGLSLTLLDDDYERTYQLLGLMLPVVMVLIWISARHHHPSNPNLKEPSAGT